MKLSEASAELPLMAANLAAKRATTFKGDVMRLMSGTVLAQGLAIFASPIITRLFDPADFGAAAVVASFAAVLSVVACLRYELAINLPVKDGEAANVFATSLLATAATASLSVLLVFAFGPSVSAAAGIPELQMYLWLVPLSVLFQGVYSSFSYWNTRTKHFTRLSISQVITALVTTGTTLGLGFLGYATVATLIAAKVLGEGVSVVLLGGQVLRDDRGIFRAAVGRAEIKRMARRYRHFPMYSSWGGLMNVASWQLPVILLGVFFSPAVVGLYALTMRIIQMPMKLIGRSMSQVFLQRAATAKHTDELGGLVETMCQRLISISLLPAIVLGINGDIIFEFAFGTAWRGAGVYASLLAPWALVWFISSPLSLLYVILEEQKREALMHGVIFALRMAAITVGGMIQNAYLTIACLSGCGMLAYCYLLLNIFRLSGASIKSVASRSAPAIKVSVLLGASVYLLRLAELNTPALLATSFLALAVNILLLLRANIDSPVTTRR